MKQKNRRILMCSISLVVSLMMLFNINLLQAFAGDSLTDISGAVINLESTKIIYDGTEKTPTVCEVKLDGNKLSADVYKISYSDNIGAGTATVTVEGREEEGYTGSVKKEFEIQQKEIELSIVPEDKVYDGTADVKCRVDSIEGLCDKDKGIVTAMVTAKISGGSADAGEDKGVSIESIELSSKSGEHENYYVADKVYEEQYKVNITKKALTLNLKDGIKIVQGEALPKLTADQVSYDTGYVVSGDNLDDILANAEYIYQKDNVPIYDTKKIGDVILKISATNYDINVMGKIEIISHFDESPITEDIGVFEFVSEGNV